MSNSERKEALQAKLAAARQALVEVIGNIQPDQKNLPTRNEGWNIWEIAVHIAGAESGMHTIAQRIIAQEPNQAEQAAAFDINRYNASMLHKRRSWEAPALLEMLAKSRQAMLEMLDKATEEDLSLKGYHPIGGHVTLAQLFEIVAEHEAEHAQEIKEALQAVRT